MVLERVSDDKFYGTVDERFSNFKIITIKKTYLNQILSVVCTYAITKSVSWRRQIRAQSRSVTSTCTILNTTCIHMFSSSVDVVMRLREVWRRMIGSTESHWPRKTIEIVTRLRQQQQQKLMPGKVSALSYLLLSVPLTEHHHRHLNMKKKK